MPEHSASPSAGNRREAGQRSPGRHRRPGRQRSRLRSAASATVLTGAFAGVLMAPLSSASAWDGVWLQRVVTDTRVTESSGMARSGLHSGVLWTHNDSGDSARLFALAADGRTIATLPMTDVRAQDFEAMARSRDAAGRPVLYVGDIGDNGRTRSEIRVHRLLEPAVLNGASVPVTTYRFRYQDGAFDAEALLVQPRTNRIYICTKGSTGRLYAAPLTLSTSTVNVLSYVGPAPSTVTDGAFADDGRVVLRNYRSMFLYPQLGGTPTTVALPSQPQGESITFAPGGGAVYVGSEGLNSKVLGVMAPR